MNSGTKRGGDPRRLPHDQSLWLTLLQVSLLLLFISPLILLTDLPKLINCDSSRTDCKGDSECKKQRVRKTLKTCEAPTIPDTDDKRELSHSYWGSAYQQEQVLEGVLREFRFSQQEKAVREIERRITHEHLLFALKFTLVGAVLGVILKFGAGNAPPPNDPHRFIDERNMLAYVLKFPMLALCCWGAVMVSTVLDIRLQFNTLMIGTLGQWLRCLELTLPMGGVGWETFLEAQKVKIPIPGSGCLSFGESIDRHIFTYILYMMTVLVFIYVPMLTLHRNFSDELNEYAHTCLRIALYTLPVVIVLFWAFGLYFYKSNADGLYIHHAIGGLLIVVTWVALLVMKRKWREFGADRNSNIEN